MAPWHPLMLRREIEELAQGAFAAEAEVQARK
jgi:hypothetical protein